jgi:uncharacterized protein (AIM24 family)
MARFTVHSLEGTNYVTATLENESIRAEAGALCYMVGDIVIRSPRWIGPWTRFKAMMAGETAARPTYTGTGTITLESSLAGFAVVTLGQVDWLLEPGAYWASDSTVDVTYHRERMMTSLWAGEGFVYLQTRVRGSGQCVLHTRGPIEELVIEGGQRVVAEPPYVIARTANVRMRVRRATKNFWGRRNAGEPYIREYRTDDSRPGRLLVNPAPYWRQVLLKEKLTTHIAAT